MKKFLSLFLLLFFSLISFQPVSAYDFSYPEAPFYIDFNENWRHFTEEGINNLSSKDQDYLRAAFFTLDKDNFLYVRKYNQSHKHWIVFQNAKAYVQNTPKELFKEDRILNPLEAIAGKKIESFNYTFESDSLVYQTEKIKSVNSKYKIIGFWKIQGESLWEFQIISNNVSDKNIEEMLSFLSTIQFEQKEAANLVPKEDHNKNFSSFSQESTQVEDFISFLLTKTFLVRFAAGSFVFVLLVLVLNFFRKK